MGTLLMSGGFVFIGATGFIVAALAAGHAVAVAFESGRLEPIPAVWGAMAWAVLVLSVGGISMFLALLRRGAA